MGDPLNPNVYSLAVVDGKSCPVFPPTLERMGRSLRRRWTGEGKNLRFGVWICGERVVFLLG